jgi:hypothetical protein
MDGLSGAASRQLAANGLNEIEGQSEPRPARDVAPGECWAFVEHRSMAEVIAAERRP